VLNITREEQYDLDNLKKYEKKDLLGKSFIIDFMTESYLGDNGFFKLCFLKVDSEEVNGFTFISSNSALDKPGVIGIKVTLIEKISKNKYTYYKYSEPELTTQETIIPKTPPLQKRSNVNISKPKK